MARVCQRSRHSLLSMAQDENEPTSVIEEFLCELTPITQSAFLGFMNANQMLTAQQIVVLSQSDLERLLENGGLPQLRCNPTFGVSQMDYKVLLSTCVRELWLAACRVASPILLSSLSSVVQSELSRPKLRFCDKTLDERFGSCFLTKGVLDVVGEASSGKTQFCLQILLNCITPSESGGLGKGAFYIHTEGEFPLKRWEQLRNFRARSLPNGICLLEDQLVIQRVSSVEAMDAILERIRPILRAKQCAVLILDSVASLVRDLPTDQKHSILYRWILHLQETSDDVGVPIITTNHVVDFIDDSGTSSNLGSFAAPKTSLGVAKRHSSFLASGRRVLPALGLRWSELVNARLALIRTPQRYDGPVQLSKVSSTNSSEYDGLLGSESADDLAPSTKKRKLLETSQMSSIATPHSWEDATVIIRHMQILFSPSSEELHADFFIDGAGLHGIP